MQPQTPKIDIIWNMTLICPWNCAICCVDAVQVTKRDGQISLHSRALKDVDMIDEQAQSGTIFDQALRHRQARQLELTYDQKIAVLDHLQGYQVKLDFSGGDPLVVAENLTVLRQARSRFEREQITLTATGAGLAHRTVDEIAPLIGELNFSYDNVAVTGYGPRPTGYAQSNLRRARDYAQAGVKTRAECALTTENCDDATLEQIYAHVCAAGTDQLLLMRLFPVGRAMVKASSVPTPSQYRRAINVLRNAEQKQRSAGRHATRVKVQCALKFFDNAHAYVAGDNPCDMVRESLGLMADGTLLASPWAVRRDGKPLDAAWVLGNLATTPLADILESDTVRAMRARLDENKGQCKIHAYLSSKKSEPTERMFDDADPLYAKALTGAR